MRLTSLVLFVALVVAVTVDLSARQAPASATDAKIIELERSVLAAFIKGDAKAFQQQLLPTAFGIDPSAGVVGVPQWLDAMKHYKVGKWNIDNAQVRWIGKDTAVVAYRFTGMGTYMGQPIPNQTWNTSIWVNQNGAWKSTFHQESVAAPPAPPAKK